MTAAPVLSVVAPVYNEEKGIVEFHRQLSAVLKTMGLPCEILLVNDGSKDGTSALLEDIARRDATVRVLEFSRNFGHQAAIKAGLDHARGQAVVVMDADLQDPPETLPEFVAKWKEGYDVVYAVRASRAGETLFKKFTSAAYYRFLRKISNVDIPADVGDFRLISRRMADVLKGMREQGPYIRGLVVWAGFRQIGIPIQRQARFAGETRYPLSLMLKLAWSGVAHFSFLPLRLPLYFGSAAVFASALMGARLLWMRAAGVPTWHWACVTSVVFFFGGVQLISIGVLGSYLARTYDETRGRPLYILKNPE
ncbi:MAG TPA: glycosyltransferase family 2 protein [Candidatus Eisenbacteria bacterium]|nr:glycosyltransferase family 2 protein [Candidatus Eisenbacteria bacterium]